MDANYTEIKYTNRTNIKFVSNNRKTCFSLTLLF